MLDKHLEQTLNEAFQSARQDRHEFITVEHLLVALLENPHACKALEGMWRRPGKPGRGPAALHRPQLRAHGERGTGQPADHRLQPGVAACRPADAGRRQE